MRHVIKRGLMVLSGVAAGGGTYLATHDVWEKGIGDYMRKIDAERAHELALLGLKLGLFAPWFRQNPPEDDPALRVRLWGVELSNPIGLAAGFDKNAEVVPGLFALGFGAIEVGTVTPEPQKGNPRPRVFRLEEDRAVINRYGFPSVGSKKVERRLSWWDSRVKGTIGANVGVNKNTDDPVAQFCDGVARLGRNVDYVVVNVSSPNTPGLRALQARDALRALLTPIVAVRDSLPFRPPLLVKIAPDLNENELFDIATVAREAGVDGIVVSNTTVARDPDLESPLAAEKGGLSGRPLEKRSTQLVSELYRLTEGQLVIVGVGGVETGADAYRKIRAGASFVQLYTALVYHGPWLVERMKEELLDLLRQDGFKSIEEAIGVDHPNIKRRKSP